MLDRRSRKTVPMALGVPVPLLGSVAPVQLRGNLPCSTCVSAVGVDTGAVKVEAPPSLELTTC